jgi:hypothetical protein
MFEVKGRRVLGVTRHGVEAQSRDGSNKGSLERGRVRSNNNGRRKTKL